MKRTTVLVFVLFFISACGGSGGQAAPDVVIVPDPPTTSEQLAEDLEGLTLSDFYEQSFAALTYRSPEGIIWNALTSIYPLDNVGLDDMSVEYKRETFAIHQVVLDALKTYDKSTLVADDLLTYELYEWFLQDNVDRLEFIFYDFIATYNFSGVQDGTERFFTDIHPMASKQDALDFITRLRAVDLKYSQVIDFLTQQSAAGIVEPSITLGVAHYYTDLTAMTTAVDSIFYTSFDAKLDAIAGLSDVEKQEFRDSALAALLERLIHILPRTYLQ